MTQVEMAELLKLFGLTAARSKHKNGQWRGKSLAVAFYLIGELVSGEPWWDRTTDPLIKSQVLSQLS